MNPVLQDMLFFGILSQTFILLALFLLAVRILIEPIREVRVFDRLNRIINVIIYPLLTFIVVIVIINIAIIIF